MRRLWIVIALVVAGMSVAAADPPSKADRMLGLARVWAKVKFYHPYLGYQDVDWDGALVAAIPKVEAANDDASYRAALQSMLDVLHDPATRVAPAQPPAPPAAAAPAGLDWLTWPQKDVVAIDLPAMSGTTFDFVRIQNAVERMTTEAAKAKVMVIDLGTDPSPDAIGMGGYALDQMMPVWPATAAWPKERMIEHHGYRTQEGQTSGGYFSTFVTIGGQPVRAGPKVGPQQVVFVVRDGIGIPAVALALQASGHGTIVATGEPSDDAAITTADVDAGGGVTVKVRITELEWPAIAADITVGKGQDARARALAAAKAAIAKKPRPRKLGASGLPSYQDRNDDDYAATPYPSRELRILAGIKAWAVLDQFHPYRYLVKDWDGVLGEMLPRLDAAKDADAYKAVLREMGARAKDGHINVFSGDWKATKKANGIPPFMLRLVEHKLAVTQVLDAAAAEKLGVGLGDVIETIDGRPAADVMAEKRAVTSASTDEAREQDLAENALVGDDGTTVKLSVRGAKGAAREVTATRTAASLALAWKDATGPRWKLLPGGDLGYVDLRVLEVPDVDQMFKDLASTKGIIFDMRGYPKGTAWSVAPRINTKHAKYGAMFLQPLRAGLDGDEGDQRVYFLQTIPTTTDPIYTGKIAVLIDDRAISQSEHSCLFYREAAGAIFVGSPTHGANGDITVARLPGGLRMSFTGQEVKHVDGSQLQQVGIQPDVLVRPTLAGVRAGKDELLDKAIATLRAKK